MKETLRDHFTQPAGKRDLLEVHGHLNVTVFQSPNKIKHSLMAEDTAHPSQKVEGLQGPPESLKVSQFYISG